MYGREEGGRYSVSLRPVTRSDLKQERSFFWWECLDSFATGCLSPSYAYTFGARSLNGVKPGALFAPKKVVQKTVFHFLRFACLKNGETKTAVFGPFVYVVICKELGF